MEAMLSLYRYCIGNFITKGAKLYTEAYGCKTPVGCVCSSLPVIPYFLPFNPGERKCIIPWCHVTCVPEQNHGAVYSGCRIFFP